MLTLTEKLTKNSFFELGKIGHIRSMQQFSRKNKEIPQKCNIDKIKVFCVVWLCSWYCFCGAKPARVWLVYWISIELLWSFHIPFSAKIQTMWNANAVLEFLKVIMTIEKPLINQMMYMFFYYLISLGFVFLGSVSFVAVNGTFIPSHLLQPFKSFLKILGSPLWKSHGYQVSIIWLFDGFSMVICHVNFQYLISILHGLNFRAKKYVKRS